MLKASVFIVVCIVVCMALFFATEALAENNISLSNATVKIGEIASVSINAGKISSKEDIISLQFTISYDENVLVPVSVEQGKLTSGWIKTENLKQPGEIIIAFIPNFSEKDSGLNKKGGELAKINFMAKPDALPGKTEISLVKASFNNISFGQLKAGTIRVASK